MEKLRKEVKERFDRADMEYCGFRWYFKEHVATVEKESEKLCEKYGGDAEVVKAAALLHDIGLIGKGREGHVKRSVERGKKLLDKHGFNEEFQEKVAEIIKQEKDSKEAKILDTADALGHLKSMHFFGKAAITQDLEEFREWGLEKLDNDLNRIAFEDEKDEAEQIAEVLREQLSYSR
ncbi:MAG: HDIG domain-containing protein [Candidatus Nanohaloarchaeota archaeon QJJ-9]|nr:HDIG domain-containing protein [Candidatus Nanohaloarchaeota archaeon QJJ-9]